MTQIEFWRLIRDDKVGLIPQKHKWWWITLAESTPTKQYYAPAH